eukprot:1808599-Prymnesium_polylepis.1
MDEKSAGVWVRKDVFKLCVGCEYSHFERKKARVVRARDFSGGAKKPVEFSGFMRRMSGFPLKDTT